MLNCAVIMGRLAADPELRTTGTGKNVTSFSVAVDRSYVRSGEERQTDWIDCVVWGQTAEFVTKYFRKGSMIAVQGHIQTRSYDDKNGNRRKAVELVADNVSFCGSRNEGSNPVEDNIRAAVQPAPSYSTGDTDDFKEIPTEDDLPF